ncbi:MAG TPA: hypothetical protein VHA37_02940 [Candidatus Saccharimonadales bacterium]|nr:hypothetical protein [Candidatus Saccharimonadales bacterium]
MRNLDEVEVRGVAGGLIAGPVDWIGGWAVGKALDWFVGYVEDGLQTGAPGFIEGDPNLPANVYGA